MKASASVNSNMCKQLTQGRTKH